MSVYTRSFFFLCTFCEPGFVLTCFGGGRFPSDLEFFGDVFDVLVDFVAPPFPLALFDGPFLLDPLVGAILEPLIAAFSLTILSCKSYLKWESELPIEITL